jgi:choline dehydrogenase-like flavoprotein
LQVLIIEAGLNNDNPNITTPAFAFENIAQPNSPYFDQYVSTPSHYVNGRNVIVQSGRVLGGGSSVNFMMYARPAASDIDDWNTEGWSFNEMEPLFKKVFCQRPAVNNVSLKHIMSQKAKMITAMMDQFMFLTVELRVIFRATFPKLPKSIMELTRSLIYKTSIE